VSGQLYFFGPITSAVPVAPIAKRQYWTFAQYWGFDEFPRPSFALLLDWHRERHSGLCDFLERRAS